LPDRLEEHVLVLASASEARASLLRHAGVELRLCPSDVDEDPLKDRLAALGYGGRLVARRLAEEKALEVSARIKDALVLGGDQTLVLGSRLFSKAASRLEAYEALNALSGRDHTLHAAYAFARRGRLIASGLESAIWTRPQPLSIGVWVVTRSKRSAEAFSKRSTGTIRPFSDCR
jgi:septum formation protein